MQFEQSLPPTKDKRSLREIQQEEQARQVEADFLKWWEEAEARVRLEAEGPIQDVTPASGQRKAKTTKASKGNAVAAAQDHGSGLGTAEVRQHGHPPSVGNPKDDQGSRGGMHQKARGSAQPGFEPPQPGDIFMTHERQGEARRGGRGGRGAHRGGRGGHGAHGQLSTTRPLTQIT